MSKCVKLEFSFAGRVYDLTLVYQHKYRRQKRMFTVLKLTVNRVQF